MHNLTTIKMYKSVMRIPCWKFIMDCKKKWDSSCLTWRSKCNNSLPIAWIRVSWIRILSQASSIKRIKRKALIRKLKMSNMNILMKKSHQESQNKLKIITKHCKWWKLNRIRPKYRMRNNQRDLDSLKNSTPSRT